MKILKIASYYKSFFRYYYSKFPKIVEKTYREQYEHIMKQYFGWSDFFKKSFEKQNADAVEIIFNALPMQRTWAKENNFHGKPLDILLEQIKKHKPDVVWFQDSISFDAEFIKLVKNLDFVRLVVGNFCSPYTQKNIEVLKNFDFVTTCSPKFEKDFNAYGLKTLMMYHAFSPEVLREVGEVERSRDFVFIGSLIPQKGFHLNRKEFLEKIAAAENINFDYYGNLANAKLTEVLKSQVLYVTKEIMQATGVSRFFQNSVRYKKMENMTSFPKYLRLSKKLQRAYKGSVFGIDMFRELAKTKITIDFQVAAEGEYAGNMRIFETTGMGVCLLLENKVNVRDIFEPDEEVVIFNSIDEAVEKILWLSKNEKKAAEIGKAAQKRILKDHTYDLRAEKFLSEVKKYL